jgi:hypothetical protein
MTIRDWLIKRIKKAFENTEATITSVIVIALLGGSATILAISKKALNFSLQILTTPTPLWATILLVLLGYLYIYLKFRQIQASSAPRTTTANEYKIGYFTIGKLKWKTKIYESGDFEVDKYPICIKHDLTFVYGNSYIYCPENLYGRCDNKIYDSNRSQIYEAAKSYIEKEIRTNYGSASLKEEPLKPASASSEPDPRPRLFNRPRP